MENKNRLPQELRIRNASGGIHRGIMRTALDETEVLVGRLEQDPDPETVRSDAARLILRQLESGSEPLDAWEKMHFEMAIALLPTVWLRLSLTHLRMALDSVLPDAREQVVKERSEQFESITRAELLERVRPLVSDLLATPR